MHEKSFACPGVGVPDRNSKIRAFADLCLETLVLEGRNGLMNTVFLGDIGNWRALA